MSAPLFTTKPRWMQEFAAARERAAKVAEPPSRYPLDKPTVRKGEATAARADKQRRIEALWGFGT